MLARVFLKLSEVDIPALGGTMNSAILNKKNTLCRPIKWAKDKQPVLQELSILIKNKMQAVKNLKGKESIGNLTPWCYFGLKLHKLKAAWSVARDYGIYIYIYIDQNI